MKHPQAKLVIGNTEIGEYKTSLSLSNYPEVSDSSSALLLQNVCQL